MGESICRAIKSFFWTGNFLSEVNATIIHLIPKGENPSSPTENRPIACCTVLYMIILKMICNRIQAVLSSLIHNSQNAFVEGCLITDNIMLCQEFNFGVWKKEHFPEMHVETGYSWNLWFCIMKIFGRALIALWLSSIVGSKDFEMSLLSVIVLTSMALWLVVLKGWGVWGKTTGLFHYHPRCKRLKIMELCFADDLLIFCKADVQSLKLINAGVEQFVKESGLQMNLNKSSLFLAGICSIIDL